MSSNKKGYTLIEIVIVIAVLALLSFLVAAFITNAMDAYVFVKVREKGLSDARLALNRVTRELKHISKPEHIITMTTTECYFVKIGTGVIDIKQVGTEVYLDSDVLISDVVSPEGLSFYYYDANADPTDISNDVRSIIIRLKVVRKGEQVLLESGVKVRNK